jgi:Tol biopolymer transport system component
MRLGSGSRVGPYEILAPLGAGGMGEVYRAHDSKLERDVALKTLRNEFALDSERLARFRREARTLASLNHPNIAAIYGLEEFDGAVCLILEFVDGETLRGPLPVPRALQYARQVSEALEAAHKKGIIHRDLKPANVKVTPEGIVKVLDFGLAKVVWGGEPNWDLTEVTTVTQLETIVGRIVGTPPYMSPEQARGRPVDHRTDIWAFGCVLYELLAGKRAFGGATLPDIVSAIVGADPDWQALPSTTPASIRRLLRKCLEKDITQRPQDIGEVRADIEQSVAAPHRQRARRRWMLGAAAPVAFAFGTALYMRSPTRLGAPSAAPLRDISFTQLTDQPGQEIYPNLSPDGRSFVYAGRPSGKWDIYLQRVGGRNAVDLTTDSTADNTSPVFSPDGEQIVFRSERDGGGIFMMGATGENLKRITDFGYNPAWSPDGREIVCSSATFTTPADRQSSQSQLFRVNVATGERRAVTAQEGTAMQPQWSPHGYRIAYWSVTRGQHDIWTIPANGGEPAAITQDAALDWNPVWSPEGNYLYFASNRSGSMNLWRVPIDEKSGKVLAGAEPVTTPSSESGYLSLSRSGRQIVYAQMQRASNIFRIGFDSTREVAVGQPVPVTRGSRNARIPDVSPDGGWIAFFSGGKQEDIFVVRLDGTAMRQLTDDAYSDRRPAWSPDGKLLAFHSNRGGKYDVWTIRPDGSGLQQLTHIADGFVTHPVWSPDGKRLVYSIQNRVPFVMEPDKPWASQSPQALQPLKEPDTWYEASSWSTDGRKLAGFQVRADGKFTGISTYSFATRQYDQITDFGWDCHWLSDSRRVLVGPSPPDLSAIHLVDSQSHRVHKVLSVAPNEVGQVALSPDNRWIYFSMGVTESDIWLVSFK